MSSVILFLFEVFFLDLIYYTRFREFVKSFFKKIIFSFVVIALFISDV
ncbi:hypothetical protein U722_03115 [Bacillus amyloliquefaciens LFB112]|nr:hypothetical protein U722_03115 [Bacillus amyloliquefaciens LFB112]